MKLNNEPAALRTMPALQLLKSLQHRKGRLVTSSRRCTAPTEELLLLQKSLRQQRVIIGKSIWRIAIRKKKAALAPFLFCSFEHYLNYHAAHMRSSSGAVMPSPSSWHAACIQLINTSAQSAFLRISSLKKLPEPASRKTLPKVLHQ